MFDSKELSARLIRKLPTYPSPKSTFCPKWEVSINVCLKKGVGGQSPRNLNWPNIFCQTALPRWKWNGIFYYYVIIIAAGHQPAADNILDRFEIFRSMVQWFNGSPWFHGSMVPWFHGHSDCSAVQSAVCLSKCLAAAPLFLLGATRHFVLLSCKICAEIVVHRMLAVLKVTDISTTGTVVIFSQSKSLTLKMTTTSVTVNNNSPIQDYVHSDARTQPIWNDSWVQTFPDIKFPPSFGDVQPKFCFVQPRWCLYFIGHNMSFQEKQNSSNPALFTDVWSSIKKTGNNDTAGTGHWRLKPA